MYVGAYLLPNWSVVFRLCAGYILLPFDTWVLSVSTPTPDISNIYLNPEEACLPLQFLLFFFAGRLRKEC